MQTILKKWWTIESKERFRRNPISKADSDVNTNVNSVNANMCIWG